MKIWLLIMTNKAEPESKVYVMSAFSDKNAAKARMNKTNEGNLDANCQIVQVEVDGPQPPILLGIAPDHIMDDCKKNSPNSL